MMKLFFSVFVVLFHFFYSLEALSWTVVNASRNSSFFYVGSVENVIDGVIPNDLREELFSASLVDVGFEAGTPKGWNSLGEFFLANGRAYSRSTDQNSSEYYQVISGEEFLTTGSIFLPKGEQEAYRIEGENETMSWDALYQYINQQTNNTPFCFVGFVEFHYLHAIAISRAPIFNENIFNNRAEYYSQPAHNTTNQFAFAMGCAANFSINWNEDYRKNLERILYDNPFDTTQALSVHTHILELSEELFSWSDITEDKVTGVWHLLSDSIFSKISMRVYHIGELNPLNNDPSSSASSIRISMMWLLICCILYFFSH